MSHPFKITTEGFLQSYADAFNAQDKYAVMWHMTKGCVFAAFPYAHRINSKHFIIENRGFSECTFTGTKMHGTCVKMTNCDLLTIEDGKIAIKNLYRKNRIHVS